MYMCAYISAHDIFCHKWNQDCEAHVKSMDADGKKVVPESGKQELYEMVLNHYV